MVYLICANGISVMYLTICTLTMDMAVCVTILLHGSKARQWLSRFASRSNVGSDISLEICMATLIDVRDIMLL